MRTGVIIGGGVVAIIGIVLLVIGMVLTGVTSQECDEYGVWIFQYEDCVTSHPYYAPGMALSSLGWVMMLLVGVPIAVIGVIVKPKPERQQTIIYQYGPPQQPPQYPPQPPQYPPGQQPPPQP